MNKQNIKISTRLILGFGVIVLFVAAMSGLTFWQAQKLWQTTDDLYQHPFQVSKATRDIKADILAMHRSMRELVNSEKSSDIQESIREYNVYENEANQSFNLIYERYLGPKEDIDSTYNAFKDWKAITDETKRLKLAGFDDSAKVRTMKFAVGGRQVTKILTDIDTVINFASKKADMFYIQAQKDRDWIATRIWVAIILIMISTVFIAYYLIRSIRNPLKQMTLATASYSQGNYNARAEYISNNEIGQLSASLNNMAKIVQTTIDIKEKVSNITDLIIKENDIKLFSNKLIQSLLEETGSQTAAIYYLDYNGEVFNPYYSVGLPKEIVKPFSVQDKEGEFGLLLTGKKILHLANIPDDSVITFRTVIGTFKPKSIISIPIINDDVIVAVISLASIHEYSPLTLQLINAVHTTLNERIKGVLLFNRTLEYSAKLDIQNRELEAQSKEMQIQSEELKEYNIELELQKKQLNESNQLKSSFLSNMSHELRTPLNSVIALSGVLNRKLVDKISEDEYKYLNIIEKNGKNLLALINDILDLSRIESGYEEVQYSTFSIYEVVQNIIESQEPIIKEKDINVINSISETIAPIISDSTKVHHILQNIITNAIKFTEKGSVKINAFEDKEHMLISVEDTGIGIAEENIPYIFDEFRQADERASRKFGGTGLGLAIAKKYSSMLDGFININSKPGLGSIFTFKILKKPSNANTVNPQFTNFSLKQNGKSLQDIDNKTSKSLLLVEDSEPVVIQMKDILEEYGYRITIARNGKEALDYLDILEYDAMILDLMMPEVDGFEVLKLLRNREKPNLIPVLILSAKHITKDELSFLKTNNIYQLIQKGDINKSELLSSISNMTNIKQSEKVVSKTITPVSILNGNKPKILLIEDNHDNNLTVKALLGDNYDVISATNGKDGINHAITSKPDIILLDISLPEVDGYTIFKELRKEPSIESIPIIAFTAKAMKGDKEKLLEYGFDDYISKPIESQHFENTLNKWLNRNEHD